VFVSLISATSCRLTACCAVRTLNDMPIAERPLSAFGRQLIAICRCDHVLRRTLARSGVPRAFDRRRLSRWSLLWFAAGHALSCLEAAATLQLWPVRALTMLRAAVFTPPSPRLDRLHDPARHLCARYLIFPRLVVSSVSRPAALAMDRSLTAAQRVLRDRRHSVRVA